jgi:hypothetical protein
MSGRMMVRGVVGVAVMMTSLSVASLAGAQQLPNEGPVPTTALITVNSKNDVQLDPSQLKLKLNRRDSPITAVTPLNPQRAQVAILIDEGLRSNFSLQLDEIKQFINELPPGTHALIGYMQNGTVRTQGFTDNKEALAGQLRVTMSIGGVDASPYFSLSEFVKNWPARVAGPRVVLMVTNGIDPYNGRPSVMNQDSPYVQTAQEDAERAGVAVYSIYYPQTGMRGGSFSGQSYLSQIAEATGGTLFNMGSIPPVSFKPYLEQFRKAILESYTVSFMATPMGKRGSDLTQIKLTTSQPGVKIVAPQNVQPGVSQ